MPNPKYRHGKARNRRDRAIWKKHIDHAGTIGTCANPECGKPVLPHHVCMACGFYKGRKAVNVKSE